MATVNNENHLKRQQNQLLKRCQQTTYDVQNTFMLPCIVVDFFLNNQPDKCIVIKLYVSGILSAHHQKFSTVHSSPVSFTQGLMTVSKQSQDGAPS